MFSKEKVELLVIFFFKCSNHFQVCPSFQALCIIFVIHLITQVMTQTFWQGGSVQTRMVSLSAVLFSCHVSTRPLSVSHNISAQQHPAPHWVVITGNTATLVSECVLLYLCALGAASPENELWRGWEADWDPGGPVQTDRSFTACTVHTSLGSYGLTSSNREICQALRENKEVEEQECVCVHVCVCLWICDECCLAIRRGFRGRNMLGVITSSVDPHDCSAPSATPKSAPLLCVWALG